MDDRTVKTKTRRTSQSATPAADAGRAKREVRAAVAVWLERLRSTLNDLYQSASAMHDELKTNPTGLVAEVLAGQAEELYALASNLSAADSSACGLCLAPEVPLPDPLAVARGGKAGA